MENSNFRTTIRALQFVMAWGLATVELGQEPQSIEEFAETMKMSRRTAFRNQEAFRQAYPTEGTPARMNKVTGAQDRYDATYQELKNIGKALKKAEPLTFFVGSAVADV
jgi:hypothetical protein